MHTYTMPRTCTLPCFSPCVTTSLSPTLRILPTCFVLDLLSLPCLLSFLTTHAFFFLLILAIPFSHRTVSVAHPHPIQTCSFDCSLIPFVFFLFTILRVWYCSSRSAARVIVIQSVTDCLSLFFVLVSRQHNCCYSFPLTTPLLRTSSLHNPRCSPSASTSSSSSPR